MSNNIQDEYIVIIEKIGNRFYYKNGQLHRESGPAYVPWKLKEEFTGLEDQELYQKVFKQHAKESEYESYASDGTTILARARPDYPCYHLNGKEYNKEQFDSIILKQELDAQLNKNELSPKKLKI